MPDYREPIIDAAAIGITGDAETRLAVRQQVGDLLDTAAQGSPEDHLRVLHRWQERGCPGRLRHWKMVFWAVVAIASAAALWFNLPDFIWYHRYARDWGNSEELRDEARAVYSKRGLSHQQILLLFGDPEEYELRPQRKKLWQLEPDNPAYFSEYAMAWKQKNNTLPPGFGETAARIDPDNAFFVYLAAASKAKGSVERNSPGRDERKAGKTDTWDILDEAALNEALALAASAKNLERYETYRRKMAHDRLSILRMEGGVRE